MVCHMTLYSLPSFQYYLFLGCYANEALLPPILSYEVEFAVVLRVVKVTNMATKSDDPLQLPHL